jgi:hypothetical protein
MRPSKLSCVRLVTLTDVADGIWEHTGITAEAGAVCVLAGFLPPRSMGRHSRWNIDGRTLALKDRPKVQVAYSWDSPNFGDYTKGSHTVWMDREVFQRETRYGKALEIATQTVGTPTEAGQRVLFKIGQPLSRTAPNFDRELLEAINVLQENTGFADVHSSDMSSAEYARTVRVDWELLPVGNIEDLVREVTGRIGRNGPVPDTVTERMRVFSSLRPQNIVVGTSGFSRYIGAQIQGDLIVLENPVHGNAVYVLGSDWQEVSRRTRVDLLRDETAHYERIVHRDGWEGRLRDIVEARRER